MTAKPKEVADVHYSICQSANCDAIDKVNFNDPCAACPNGHWGQYESTSCEDGVGLGDVVAFIAQPIAKGIDKIFGTQVTNCGGCKKRQENLNKLYATKKR